MAAVVRGGLILILLAAILTGGAVWLVPEQAAQTWMMNRAAPDTISQFQAAGEAEALWWLLRAAAPAIVMITVVALVFRGKVTGFCERFWRELLLSIAPESRDSSTPGAMEQPGGFIRLRSNWTIFLKQILIAAWFLLAVYHGVTGLQQRVKEWPVYRLKTGPNISDSNRDVIRYLTRATPAEARILVLSDQKLYFVSYYTLPRRIYHPIHPDSEYVIPMPYGQRQLAAHRLSDLAPEYLQNLRPDYVLEYFESAAYIDRARLEADGGWLAFLRSRYGPEHRPSYLVNLRPVQAVVPP